MSEDNVGNINTVCDGENIMDGPKWVDLFVHEMMNATDLDDARGCAARILEAFETSITANSKISEEVISIYAFL